MDQCLDHMLGEEKIYQLNFGSFCYVCLVVCFIDHSGKENWLCATNPLIKIIFARNSLVLFQPFFVNNFNHVPPNWEPYLLWVKSMFCCHSMCFANSCLLFYTSNIQIQNQIVIPYDNSVNKWFRVMTAQQRRIETFASDFGAKLYSESKHSVYAFSLIKHIA